PSGHQTAEHVIDTSKKWEEIYAFISAGSYPSGYDKAQRQNLRRYASKFKQKELFVGTRRVVKTMDDARKIFHEFHSSPIGGHTGTHKTLNAVCSRFYWFGMTVDIKTWVCINCLYCLWELIGIDLTGPLPKTSSGFQYILTATDYFSKWVEAFPLKTKSASEVAQHLCSIIYRHGCPKRILSDQGREFVNEVSLLQIERSVTAAYHPQTNGLDEKTNDNIKRALRKLVNDQQNNWDLYLEPTLFSLRSKVHTTTKYTPFFLMYGREAVFPSEVPILCHSVCTKNSSGKISPSTRRACTSDPPETQHARKGGIAKNLILTGWSIVACLASQMDRMFYFFLPSC
uniref:Integrase catalytic domain-containing protein n=1 Tax=Maylandia zebra TaxID=106582 RepID=A0A3P9CHI7_9CICH